MRKKQHSEMTNESAEIIAMPMKAMPAKTAPKPRAPKKTVGVEVAQFKYEPSNGAANGSAGLGHLAEAVAHNQEENGRRTLAAESRSDHWHC